VYYDVPPPTDPTAAPPTPTLVRLPQIISARISAWLSGSKNKKFLPYHVLRDVFAATWVLSAVFAQFSSSIIGRRVPCHRL